MRRERQRVLVLALARRLLLMLFLLVLSEPVWAAKYKVYPLYMGEDCADPPCKEEYTCAHTCYLHGLECVTNDFDCQAEAEKFCGGKELTMLIPRVCASDLCDVDCDLGVYYSSQEHLGTALCDSGWASLCPRNFPNSLCQCELPIATEDLIDNSPFKFALNYKFMGLVAFAVISAGALCAKVYHWHHSENEEYSESELAMLDVEGLDRSDDYSSDALSASSSDVLLKKKKKSGIRITNGKVNNENNNRKAAKRSRNS